MYPVKYSFWWRSDGVGNLISIGKLFNDGGPMYFDEYFPWFQCSSIEDVEILPGSGVRAF